MDKVQKQGIVSAYTPINVWIVQWNCLYIERKTIAAVNKTEKISITVTPNRRKDGKEQADKKEMPLASFVRYCTNAHIEAMERYIKRYKSEDV